MENAPSGQATVLVTRLGARLCALPLTVVVECMRPRPIEPLPEVSPYLLGLSLIRGTPVPVVHLAALVGSRTDARITRFVLLRLGERKAAIAVEDVLGVRRLDGDILHNLPPLLQGASSELMTAIGVRDEQLFFVLRLTHVIPDEVWQTLDSSGGRA